MCSQPSSTPPNDGRVADAVVALEDVRAADEDLAVVGDLDLGARERAADGAELVVGDRGGGGDRGGLGHPVALEHGRAAGVEELEDLAADRGGAGRRLLQVAAEDVADVDEQLGVGLVERGCSSAGTSWPASCIRRTFRPSCVAPAIFSGSLLDVTSV